MSVTRHVWTARDDAMLEYMWTSGANAAQLRRCFPTISINSIYGRRKRLGLTPRYLKIVPTEKARIRQRRAGKTTLPPLRSLSP